MRAGGRLAHASPRSMVVEGSVADWETWTGMAFPESGRYTVECGCEPVTIDREADAGRYFDSNVWIVHALAEDR